MSVMHKSIIVLLVSFVPFLFSTNAVAKTAAEVFEKASQSIVVVKIQDDKGKDIALGSGVVLPGGDVVTNCHVIEKAVGITVYQGMKSYHAVPRYIDYDRDVCSLSVQNMKAPAISIGSTKTLKIGYRVYAIGTPQGLTLTLSEGIISSLRPVEGGQYLQLTAPISPGSSGGGLFDEEGRLIGLTTFYLADGQQLNFAVPVEWIGELAKRHKKDLKTAETYVDWLNKAMVLEKKKEWRELINHALQRVKALPRSAVAWYNLGIAYGVLGQTAKAIEAYKQSLRINPEDADTWYNLGNDYRVSGQTGKAIEAYQQALRINPEYADAWFNLGIAYHVLGQTGQVNEIYKRLKAIDPKEADKFFNKVILP